MGVHRYQFHVDLRRLDAVRIPGEPMTATMTCGTMSAYNRHYREGTTPCDECRKARAEYAKGHVPRKNLGLPVGTKLNGTSARVLDILETVPELWFSADMLEAELEAAGHPVKRATLDRAVRRLFDRDIVQRRLVDAVSRSDGVRMRGRPQVLEVRHAG